MVTYGCGCQMVLITDLPHPLECYEHKASIWKITTIED